MFGKGNRLYKREKLRSVTSIDRLFAARPPKAGAEGDAAARGVGMSLAYPLRMVYGANPGRGGAPVQFLVSVPKKKLRRAVDRVAMRRRIREAYRLTRGPVESLPADVGAVPLDVAFIYVADKLVSYRRVESAMKRLVAILDAVSRPGVSQ